MHAGKSSSGCRIQQLERLLLLLAWTGPRCCVLYTPRGSPIALLPFLTHLMITFFFLFPLPFCRMLLRSKNSKSTAPLTHISMPRCVLCSHPCCKLHSPAASCNFSQLQWFQFTLQLLGGRVKQDQLPPVGYLFKAVLDSQVKGCFSSLPWGSFTA